ncbi:MAG TPA: hypothetical protein VIU43_06680, partial [Nitrosospira sp.]
MLNGLIDISRDGVEGFKTCAEDVRDPSLKIRMVLAGVANMHPFRN